MAASNRLIVATLSDVEQYKPGLLRQGLIKSNFLPGPFVHSACRSMPRIPEGWNKQPPRLVTLPNEILKMILGYLEPIWLFQAEAAHPQICALLASLKSIWYENLPPALFAEAEHFQDEDGVASQSLQAFNSLQLAASNARPSPLSSTRYCWDQSGQRQSLIMLPKIKNMSELCLDVEWSCTLRHPSDSRSYPLIHSRNNPIRIRNLALGGPFQPEIDYRRELAGWLHHGKRCQICVLPFDDVFRPYQIDFGIAFCPDCHQNYTLTNAEVRALPGLDKLISKSTDPQWSHHRRAVGQVQWRPLVDAILRKQLGIDFETALAKEKYLVHLRAALAASRRSTENNRTRLRNEIVVTAKHIWDFSSGNSRINQAIRLARSTFAPTDTLQRFLFPPRSLDTGLLHLPFDTSERWLEDPTRLLNSREIVTRTDAWKNQVAMEMITKLCDWSSIDYHKAGYGGTVTTWIAAADHYHIQRMERTISADFAIAKLKEISLSSHGHTATFTGQGTLHSPRLAFENLGLILAKLKIPPMSPVRKQVPNKKYRSKEELNEAEQVLSDHELKMAKEVYFKKVWRACCGGCPRSGYLACAPGYAGLVKHFRVAYGQKYWTTEDWIGIG